MRVSVIVTVYNERASIGRLLDSLASQSRRPDEVIICDGGSRDGTVAAISGYAAAFPDRLPNLRVIVEPGANISQGRNAAIAAAEGPIIAATDAGVRLAPDWLAALVRPWEGDPATLAVAGFFLPDAEDVFGTAMAATVLPLTSEINPQRFLPSSRSVAFRKTAWAAAGGYPTWLDYCEDLIFDFALNAQQGQGTTAFVWAPAAVVFFRPRERLIDFWRQYYRYGRGDGKADLWRKRHLVRYVTYLVLLPALLALTVAGGVARWLGWFGLMAGLVFYCGRPWQRLVRLGAQLSLIGWLAAAALVPLIRLVGDLAKMAGYPVGLVWRWRNRHRPELAWRQQLRRIAWQSRANLAADGKETVQRDGVGGLADPLATDG